MTTPTRADGSRSRGFTLIELVLALMVVAILVRIAFPSYQAYIVRSSRQAAQSELVALANAQERIFLNSNSYTTRVTDPYTGQCFLCPGVTSPGGLGVTSGKSKDNRYDFTVTVTPTPSATQAGMSFELKATPVTGTLQAGDGNLTITETGQRTWGSKTW